MSWNRNDPTMRRNIRRGRRRISLVLLVVLAFGALVGGAVLWWVEGLGESVAQAPKAQRSAGKIADAATAAGGAATASDTVATAPDTAARIGANRDDILPVATSAVESAKAPETRPRNVIVNDGSCRPPDRYAALPLDCDKKIAGLLYAVPGQLMIGTVDFGEDFERQFKESLKTRLEPDKDATEEECEMIESVNAAKDAIVKAMKAEGKTAGEILYEAREQMREFGRYKQMLEQELRRYENDEEKTDQDVSDLFDAANRILKENEIEPFEPNDLTREVVRQYKFDQQEKNEE